MGGISPQRVVAPTTCPFEAYWSIVGNADFRNILPKVRDSADLTPGLCGGCIDRDAIPEPQRVGFVRTRRSAFRGIAEEVVQRRRIGEDNSIESAGRRWPDSMVDAPSLVDGDPELGQG